MRCFIAVDMPKGIKKQMHSVQKGFETFENIRLVNTKLLHCTLVFLGDINKKQVEDTKSAIADTTASHKTIKCTLKSIGVFPNPAYIKIIWTGIQDNNQLAGIQKYLEAALKEKQIYNPPNNRAQKFTPHITLARVRNPNNKDRILGQVEKNTTFETPVFEISEIKLKESILLPGGPEYHDIAAYKLREHT